MTLEVATGMPEAESGRVLAPIWQELAERRDAHVLQLCANPQVYV